MPLAHISLARGRSDEEKRALLQAVTQAIHESVGAPIPSIRVWITEFEATEFMAGGETLADRRTREQGER